MKYSQSQEKKISIIKKYVLILAMKVPQQLKKGHKCKILTKREKKQPKEGNLNGPLHFV